MATMEVNVNIQDTEVFKELLEKTKLYRSSYHWCAIALAIVTAICVWQAIHIQKAMVELAEIQQTAQDYAVIAEESTALAKRAITRMEQAQAELVTIQESMKIESEPQNTVSMDTIEEIQELPGKRLKVTATAYCPCPFCCGVWSEQHPSRIGTGYVQKTSSGTIPTAKRTIAVDPDVIPIGSTIYIGDQPYIAEDTGAHIKGSRIDIFFDSHEEAMQWGQRKIEVRVYEK